MRINKLLINIHTRLFSQLQPWMPSALRLPENQKGGLPVLRTSGCFLHGCTPALWTNKPKTVVRFFVRSQYQRCSCEGSSRKKFTGSSTCWNTLLIKKKKKGLTFKKILFQLLFSPFKVTTQRIHLTFSISDIQSLIPVDVHYWCCHNTHTTRAGPHPSTSHGTDAALQTSSVSKC